MIQNKSNQPLVGIVVPVYNGADFLEECLESIQNQEYENWLCIINDNNSEDNTVEIAKRFADGDSRFKIFVNEKTVPQTPNWNIAFSRFTEDIKYFKLIPHDDWIYPQHIKEYVRVLEENPTVGICSAFRLDNTAVRCYGLDIYSGEKQDGKKMLKAHLSQSIELTGSINNIMYRVDALKKIDCYPAIFREDVYHIDTFLAYDVMDVSNFGFVYQVLSYTRRHNESITNKVSNRFRTTYYLVDVSIRRKLEEFPELQSAYRNNRRKYAYFMMKKRFSDKECIEFHKKYNDKPIKGVEMLSAAFSMNIFSRQVRKLLGKGSAI